MTLHVTMHYGHNLHHITEAVFKAVGRALAERIRSQGHQAGADPELLAEVDALRAEVSELHERVDFAERLLAQRQEPGKIEAGQ